MNAGLAKVLRAIAITTGVTLAIASVIALALLGVAQMLPEELSHAHIQWGDYSTGLTGAFSGGFVEFLIALVAVTAGVLVAVLAVAFALLVTIFVLAVTAGALLFAAIVVGFPLIVVVAVVWWAVRRSSRAQRTALVSGG